MSTLHIKNKPGPSMDIRQLVRGPANLCVAFNKIKSKVQVREVAPMDLELTHYRQRVPRREKKVKKFWAWDPAPKLHAFLKAVP